MAIVQGLGEFSVTGAEPDREEIVVQGSGTGADTIYCFGTWDGATIQLKSEIRFYDGTLSGTVEIPDGSFTSDFAQAILTGKGNNLYIKVLNAGASTSLMLKATPVV